MVLLWNHNFVETTQTCSLVVISARLYPQLVSNGGYQCVSQLLKPGQLFEARVVLIPVVVDDHYCLAVLTQP